MPRVEKLLAACDLLVFPATTNHFARPIVEAAVMGKSIVASRFPIIEELVEQGETGLLVPPSEPAPLADAILALLQDLERSACLGNQAHLIARSRYDATVNVKRIMQVYDDVLGANHIYARSADLRA